MTKMYHISGGIRILLVGLLGLCVLMQALALLLNFYSKGLKKEFVFKNLLEIFVLCEILIYSLLYGQMLSAYKHGFHVPSGYEKLRLLVFSAILILGVTVSTLSKSWLPLSLMPLAAISLPAVEISLGHFYPCFFIGGLVFFLARSIKVCLVSVKGIKTGISALSVIRAIDIIQTGILFSENDGQILLANRKMRQMMRAITGRLYRNTIDFYDTVSSDQYKAQYEKVEMEGQMVYVLPDGRAWMVAKTDILIGLKNYIHISITDVSQLWMLTRQLQAQEQELKAKSKALKETMKNLYVLSKKKEMENAKIRAHDILGQRLTVLLRIIQNQETINYDLLTSLSQGLLKELTAEQNGKKPYDQLKSIQEIFAAIGIAINFEGDFPSNSQRAELFIDIIRESSTNAVRHGFATQINIALESLDGDYQLTVQNNGYTSKGPITIGHGIEIMKKKVSAYGGSLDIRQEPLFTLSVEIPGGEQYV